MHRGYATREQLLCLYIVRAYWLMVTNFLSLFSFVLLVYSSVGEKSM